jgi:hypothetical protein
MVCGRRFDSRRLHQSPNDNHSRLAFLFAERAGTRRFLRGSADCADRPTGPFGAGFRSLRPVLLSWLAGCLWAKSASSQNRTLTKQ